MNSSLTFSLLFFAVIRDSSLILLPLLLLAELCVRSSARPAPRSALCGLLRPMIHQVDGLSGLSHKLHHLTKDELANFEAAEYRLDGLPHFEQTFIHFSSMQLNQSLSQLLLYTQAFRLHADWLIKAKENVSLPSRAAEGASTHLLQLSTLINASLHQMGEEAPQLAPPSLPAVSTAFDVLRFSVEFSNRLQRFCHWSKRVLGHLQRRSCPRR
ncbi:hypothetical protein EYF80_061578 [Liparis tanakae]|uniref:Interleukin-11 n=1 Tax=Liparis tanakae TaxID=230148 RepID=A0A4Z2EII8_9TELE|nr:hypothetical protein EYF80_061578 [Liparis tanakae]